MASVGKKNMGVPTPAKLSFLGVQGYHPFGSRWFGDFLLFTFLSPLYVLPTLLAMYLYTTAILLVSVSLGVKYLSAKTTA